MASLESFDERPGLTGKHAAICPELAAALGVDAVLAPEAYLDGIEIKQCSFTETALKLHYLISMYRDKTV